MMCNGYNASRDHSSFPQVSACTRRNSFSTISLAISVITSPPALAELKTEAVLHKGEGGAMF